jgi:Zn-dependent protease with chaperone function
VNLSYFMRLLCVSFASFFVVLLAMSAIASVFARTAIRAAGRAKLQTGLRALLALRFAPAVAGAVAVLALCVPSYLWLEPAATREDVGLACFIAAMLGAAVCVAALARVGIVLWRTRRFARTCLEGGRVVRLAEGDPRAIVLNSAAPVLTLAGVFRPRVITSQGVLDSLSREELDAALAHEHAHHSARDNARRLLLLAAPRVPFLGATRKLETTWARWSEWAADDRAVESDPACSLALASALVRMARLGVSRPATALCANFASCEADLSQRVERLLHAGDTAAAPRSRTARPLFPAIALAVTGTLLAIALAQPATLHSVHEMLERFIH